MIGALVAITGALMAADGHMWGFILVAVGAISTTMERRWSRIIRQAPPMITIWDVLTVPVVLLILLACSIALGESIGVDTISIMRAVEKSLIGATQ